MNEFGLDNVEKLKSVLVAVAINNSGRIDGQWRIEEFDSDHVTGGEITDCIETDAAYGDVRTDAIATARDIGIVAGEIGPMQTHA